MCTACVSFILVGMTRAGARQQQQRRRRLDWMVEAVDVLLLLLLLLEVAVVVVVVAVVERPLLVDLARAVVVEADLADGFLAFALAALLFLPMMEGATGNCCRGGAAGNWDDGWWQMADDLLKGQARSEEDSRRGRRECVMSLC